MKRVLGTLAVIGAVLALGMGCSPDAPPTAEHRGDEIHESPSNVEIVDPRSSQALGALGYVAWEPIDSADRERAGVIQRDPVRIQPGWNLWNSLPRKRAVLMDQDGREVHAWQLATGGQWGHIEMLDDGDLLILHEQPNALIRLDWNSNVRWQRPMLAHHDADISEAGKIHVLVSKLVRMPYEGREVVIANDFLTILGDDGKLERSLSFLRMLRDRVDIASAERAARKEGRTLAGADGLNEPVLDPLHINTLSILTRDYNDVFRKGRILFASRNLNLVGLVDVALEEVVWTWGSEELDWPHQPSLLDSGNLLIFDNGTHRGHSRIVEVAPATGEIVWEYRGSPPESFFSRTMGGVQVLANGNLLITESKRGRAFEITRDGEIVWDFFNPDRDEDGAVRAGIYRMRRVEPEGLPLSED